MNRGIDQLPTFSTSLAAAESLTVEENAVVSTTGLQKRAREVRKGGRVAELEVVEVEVVDVEVVEVVNELVRQDDLALETVPSLQVRPEEAAAATQPPPAGATAVSEVAPSIAMVTWWSGERRP
ncbi:unnamed protein product [Closterium sp. NIES-53]